MPEGATRRIPLDVILGPEQLKNTLRILKSTTDSSERVKRLKDYFGTFDDTLNAQGLDVGYLAWACEASRTSILEAYKKGK